MGEFEKARKLLHDKIDRLFDEAKTWDDFEEVLEEWDHTDWIGYALDGI